MNRGLFVNKRDFEALQRTLKKTQSLLNAAKTESKKFRKKTILYANQYHVIISELNIKIQILNRNKMFAEGTRNVIEKEKISAQLETINQIKHMVLQRIAICS